MANTNVVTVRTAEDAWLEAKAQFESWMQDFQVDWFKPQTDTAKKIFWMKQPEAIKEQLRRMQPEGARQLDELVKQTGGE